MVALRSRIELREIRCPIIRTWNSAMGLGRLRSDAIPDIVSAPHQRDFHFISERTVQAVFKIVERNQAESSENSLARAMRAYKVSVTTGIKVRSQNNQSPIRRPRRSGIATRYGTYWR